MNESRRHFLAQGAALCGGVLLEGCGGGSSTAPDSPPTMGPTLTLDTNWSLLPIESVTGSPSAISSVGYGLGTWPPATVPGTVLTSLVNNGMYPEPLFGRNMEAIPDTLCRTSYWYRTEFDITPEYKGQQVWLQFDGINYLADIWLNGQEVGLLSGAFMHGYFNVTEAVGAARRVAIAVKIDPPAHPGDPHNYLIKDSGIAPGGPNGGPLLQDSPTFVCSAGWDWMPTIRDRNIGIWAPVKVFCTGAVYLSDVCVRADLQMPDMNSATLNVITTLSNVSSGVVNGSLNATLDGEPLFSWPVSIDGTSVVLVDLCTDQLSGLQMKNPRLWWPNRYGQANRYRLTLSFVVGNAILHEKTVSFGVRKIEYFHNQGSNLSLVVNGVPIFAKGGNWGMDEALKRTPRRRLDHQIRMHRDAHYNMIRNWVGQSVSADFYDLCDQYGLLVWNDFPFSSSEGPPPNDQARYLNNVRDIIRHYRNHPCIVLWCGGNEGLPPQALTDGVRKLVSELDPDRLFLSSSADTDGVGVTSGGPYDWHAPSYYFSIANDPYTPFKNETGCQSIPTIETTQAMLPQISWERMDNEWAQHNLLPYYKTLLESRYGQVKNLADFTRKAQLANYETHRAIYESRMEILLNPVTGVLLWMSNPAQPSFVWQIYSHDLEAHSSYYAVRKACEPVHVQMSTRTRGISVVNHTATAVAGMVRMRLFDLDGTVRTAKTYEVGKVLPSSSFAVGRVPLPSGLSANCFVHLEFVQTGSSQPVSESFYWYDTTEKDKNYGALDAMPPSKIRVTDARIETRDNSSFVTVSLENPTPVIALMVHLQLIDKTSGVRMLPAFYSDNYLNLVPGAKATVTIETPDSASGLAVQVDGWNLDLESTTSDQLPVSINGNAMVANWPVTGLPVGERT
jgi:Exo-beta-D-glucosaminidase Ig-fold domain/Glycosyl hydrolases family 2, sugar binding domain/Glycosyl hydrolases family 2/Glycosyl hydrolases family 2, TIM barrel domain